MGDIRYRGFKRGELELVFNCFQERAAYKEKKRDQKN